MPRETRLYWALRSRGLDVEYVPGWTTRGSSLFAPLGDLAHWTAGPRTGDRPSLNIVVNGRAGLPGPLCNVFLPRGLTISQQKAVLVAAGRANHAGRGSYGGADGNTDLFGTEAEWSGPPGELTAFQRWAYPRIHATYHDLGSRFTAGHDEYALPRGRKVDIGREIDWLRGEVDNILRQPPRDPRKTTTIDLGAKPTLEDDMPTADEIARAVWGYQNKNLEPDRDAYALLRASVAQTAGVRRGADPNAGPDGTVSLRQEVADTKTLALAVKGLVEKLAEQSGLSAEQVRQAVADGLDDALAGITADVTVEVARQDGGA